MLPGVLLIVYAKGGKKTKRKLNKMIITKNEDQQEIGKQNINAFSSFLATLLFIIQFKHVT